MRISDWSSDVCSSDLRLIDRRGAGRVLVVVSALQTAAIALIAYYPAFTHAWAALLSVLFTITSAATFTLIPVLASALVHPRARATIFFEIVCSPGMLACPVAVAALVGWMETKTTTHSW